MTSRKRPLTKEKIQELLFDDNDEVTSSSEDSELDSENDDSSDSEAVGGGSDESDIDDDNAVDQPAFSDVFDWKKNDFMRRAQQVFTGTSGLQVNINNDTDPVSYFSMFITEGMLDVIVLETNRRANQLVIAACRAHKRSRMVKWKDVDANEVRVFIAVILIQSLIHKPEQEMYWSTKPLLETPYVRKVMSEQRFSLILKCLHFTNNEDLPPTTSASEKSFFKIKDFYDALIANFSTVYIPSKNIAIDESLLLWKGRLQMKQYIPMKRARFGIKSYALCESESGYIWKAMIHIGTAMKLNDAADDLKSSKIVMTLMKDLLGKGYCVFLDNWYSSPALYRQLHVNGTDAVGTVRLNRKNMPADLKKKIKCGETISRFTEDLMALKWMDKKEVTVLSTYHTSSMETITKRGVDKVKPIAILTYNQHMGAVDVGDQMLAAFPIERKRTKVWYKKLFRHLINQTVLNSYILYKKNPDTPKLSHLQFVVKLTERLLEKYHVPDQLQRRGRPSNTTGNPLRLTARHFPMFIPANAVKQAPTKRCKVCCNRPGPDGRKFRKETRYYCPECDTALCAAPCFGVYHTKYNY